MSSKCRVQLAVGTLDKAAHLSDDTSQISLLHDAGQI